MNMNYEIEVCLDRLKNETATQVDIEKVCQSAYKLEERIRELEAESREKGAMCIVLHMRVRELEYVIEAGVKE